MNNIMNLPDEIQEYDDFHNEVEETLGHCVNPSYRTFVLAIAAGHLSIRKAAKQAGITHQTGMKIMTGDAEPHEKYRKAIKTLRRIFQAKFGAKAEWKRNQLISIVEICNDSESPHYQPGSVIKAVEQLNRMDGDHAATKVEHTGEVIMNVEYDIAMPRRKGMKVIEEVKPALEVQDAVVLDDVIPANIEFASVNVES